MNLVRFCVLAGVAMAVGCGSQTAMAQGVPSRGRAIQFSDPKVEVVTSNLNHSATSRKTSLRSLDDQFKAPFNILDSADPVGGADANMTVPVPRRPVLSTKTVKRLIDQKAEQEQWIFGSPEELEAKRLSAERMFGITEFEEDGAEKTTKTPFQRYWDRMERERLGDTNRLGSEVTSEKTDQEIKDQAKSMFSFINISTETTTENQTDAAKTPSLTPTTGRMFPVEVGSAKSSSDWFSTTPSSLTPQKSEAIANRMAEYKEMFDSKPASPIVGSGFGSSSASSFGRPSSVVNFGMPSTAWQPAPSAAPVSGFNSLQGSSLSKPLGGYPSSSLGLPATPVTQTPKFSTPPAGFQLPKRSF